MWHNPPPSDLICHSDNCHCVNDQCIPLSIILSHPKNTILQSKSGLSIRNRYLDMKEFNSIRPVSASGAQTRFGPQTKLAAYLQWENI